MGDRLTRREQVVLARILKERPSTDEIERMLVRLTARERMAIESAMAAATFPQVPRRPRRNTLRVGKP